MFLFIYASACFSSKGLIFMCMLQKCMRRTKDCSHYSKWMVYIPYIVHLFLQTWHLWQNFCQNPSHLSETEDMSSSVVATVLSSATYTSTIKYLTMHPIIWMYVYHVKTLKPEKYEYWVNTPIHLTINFFIFDYSIFYALCFNIFKQ